VQLAAAPAVAVPPARRRRPPGPTGGPATATIALAVVAEGVHRLLGSRLATEIGRHTTVAHWWGARAAAALGAADGDAGRAEEEAADRLVAEQQAGHGCVLLECDRTDTPWTRRAIRRADRLVVVVDAAPDEAQHRRAAERLALAPVACETWLVVRQPPGTTWPRGTEALARRHPTDDVLHLRSGRAGDLSRLARLASGHGVGLVLSGGGGRGNGHLGVYRALCESGVPVDRIAGASMGASIGIGLAFMEDPAEATAAFAHDYGRLIDYTLPLTSLLSGRRITESAGARLDGRQWADLLRPTRVTATNLTRAESVVLRDGDLLTALRASVAIPGLLPPVPHGTDLLVDGGVLDNFPVGAMRAERSVGTVIGVDVTPPLGPRARVDYGLSVSGWQALRRRLRGGRSPYPGVSQVLMASLLVAAQRDRNRHVLDGTCDLLLQPELKGIGLMHFDRVHEAAELAYATTRDAVARWAAESGLGAAGGGVAPCG
jgi:predicted acylesterase/phospholipase RssA